MTKRSACQYVLWLCIVVCQVFAVEEPRLYTGSIQIPTLGDLGMTLGIQDSDEGTFILLTVPTQGATNVPLEAIFMEDGSMTASLPQAQLTFVVKENVGQTRLTGHMEQGLVFPIDFERVSSLPTLNRPQHPIGPFPYKDREVTALHPDGHILAGTLTIPKGRGPFPCAILISGSGMQDRDESLMGHKPFLVIADYLTRNGIAVLRFDDRGVGGSAVDNPDDLKTVTSEDFATDAAVMVSASRMHPEIDSRRVGVIGHSEGGLIGPMVAVNDDKLAFVVMLAGPGVTGSELLPVQQALLLQASGTNPEFIDTVVNASIGLEDFFPYIMELFGWLSMDEVGVKLETQITMWSIIVSFLVAAGTGLIFGIYPAILASKQDPIVALRQRGKCNVMYSSHGVLFADWGFFARCYDG